MKNNRKRHRILKVLNHGSNDPRSKITYNEIKTQMGIEDVVLKSLLMELWTNGYIYMKNYHFSLSIMGGNAYMDKKFLNNLWYRSVNFWVMVGLGIAGLMVTVGAK